MSKLALSVVILNHRADERFQKCLDSVAFADEVIVLGETGGSKQQSHLKATPIACPVDDFGAVRNQGLALATQEWVLFLDSDEFLKPGAETKLADAMRHQAVDGFWLRRSDIFAGQQLKYGEVGNQYFLRLMRRKVAHFERTVHEFAVVAGETANLDLVIQHQPHRDVAEFLGKISRYAYIESQSRPKYSKVRWWTEVILYPPGKFIYNYGLKLGFLDGWRGLVYAYCMSLHSLMVRIYLYERDQTH